MAVSPCRRCLFRSSRWIPSRLWAVLLLLWLLPVPAHAGEPVDSALFSSLDSLRQRAAAGDPEARYRLGTLYESGYDAGGIERDSLRAMELYASAAQVGLPAAQNYYGYLLIGAGDIVQGMELIESAARAGDPKACNNLGYLLLNGDIVERDYSKAAYWYGRAASAGLPVAMVSLAGMACRGQGMPADTVKAVALYDAALGAGMTGAQRPLLDMMRLPWGRMSAPDALSLGDYYYSLRAPVVAVYLWSLAAQTPPDGCEADSLALGTRGRARALLGEAYSRGMGVKYSHADSLRYYFLAAVDGNPSAQYVMAELLSMFPDALADLTDPAALSAVNEQTSSAQYWYDCAARGGITSAAEATRALFP